MKFKTIFLVLLLVFAVGVVANASEKTDIAKVSFNFQKPASLISTGDFDSSQNPIENNTVGRGGGFLAMGIIGTIVLVTGIIMIAAGAALIAYVYTSIGSYAIAGSVYGLIGSSVFGLTYLYAGAALLGLGLTFFFIGLPLMIVGYALYSKRRNASIFMETNKREVAFSTGLSFKFN